MAPQSLLAVRSARRQSDEASPEYVAHLLHRVGKRPIAQSRALLYHGEQLLGRLLCLLQPRRRLIILATMQAEDRLLGRLLDVAAALDHALPLLIIPPNLLLQSLEVTSAVVEGGDIRDMGTGLHSPEHGVQPWQSQLAWVRCTPGWAQHRNGVHRGVSNSLQNDSHEVHEA